MQVLSPSGLKPFLSIVDLAEIVDTGGVHPSRHALIDHAHSPDHSGGESASSGMHPCHTNLVRWLQGQVRWLWLLE